MPVEQSASTDLPNNAVLGPASSSHTRRWGVILAGGDGTRLQKLTRLICGDHRPKQFCPLFGGLSLLEQTRRRAERSIPPGQILCALTNTHREFYNRDLDGFERQRIVQPANKGTAPPILFSILSIELMDENALVAILPSDHHYADEAHFQAALESAFAVAQQHPESVVLLGAQPDRLEVEYGWIELGPAVANDDSQNANHDLRRVSSFHEKPSLEVARLLMGQRSAWNTFVMVGHVRAFFAMAAQAIPWVLEPLLSAQLWTGSETQIDEFTYNQIPTSDFSRQVLSIEIENLLVLRVNNLGWSDLGSPNRVVAVLQTSASQPAWLRRWRRAKPASSAARAKVRSAVA